MRRLHLAAFGLFSSCLLLAGAFPASAQQPARETSARPNVVIVFIDDLGYADIGPFGATKQKTPHLDRMAAEGLKLTSFYAAPVCSVSRAQLLTGCYGARVSVPGVFFPASPVGLHPQETTLAEHLRGLGYATLCVGKWHLGDQPEFLPTRQGFDHYFGIPYSNDMQKPERESGRRVVPLLRDEKVVELLYEDDQRRIVEQYTDEAVRFIETNRERPFFLYLPHNAVHTPIWPGEAFRGKSQNGRFGDWVEEVDGSVGRVLETLRRLKLDQNTLVVFTSDNGPWLIKGADGGSALPLRGGKGSTWEGGVRVPTIAWWPGRIRAGAASDVVAGTIDLLPTIVSLAGGKVPAAPKIDGLDLSEVLLGRSTESPREAHYYFSGYNLQAVRQGRWKLAIAAQPRTSGADDPRDEAESLRLYDLDRDVGERTNVAAQHPEVVARLKGLAERMNAEIGGEKPAERRPAGEAAAPRTLYPTEEPKPKAKANAAAPKPSKPVDLAALRPGDAVPSSAAPQIADKAFTIRCSVATKARDGILLAHGGATYGYALHLAEGRLTFTARDRMAEAHVRTEWNADGRPHAIVATMAADGTLALKIDDGAAATARGSRISRQPQEDFCVGFDNGQPLTEYSAKGKFAGELRDLTISVP